MVCRLGFGGRAPPICQPQMRGPEELAATRDLGISNHLAIFLLIADRIMSIYRGPRLNEVLHIGNYLCPDRQLFVTSMGILLAAVTRQKRALVALSGLQKFKAPEGAAHGRQCPLANGRAWVGSQAALKD